MGRVVTSISIDEEKRDLAKKKGIVLKDLLDNALDIALGIELKESTQLMNEKEDLEQQKTILENEKDKFLKDYDKQTETLENDKEKFLKEFLKDYETKLEALEIEKETYLKNYDTKISEIDFKLKNIGNALEDAIKVDKEETKQQDYEKLLLKVFRAGGLSLDTTDTVSEFVLKYDLNIFERQELEDKIKDDCSYILAYSVGGTVEKRDPYLESLTRKYNFFGEDY